MDTKAPFWSLSPEESFLKLSTTGEGLSVEEAVSRLARLGANEIAHEARLGRFAIVINQFKSPLILILVGAGILTVILGEWIETVVIFGAVLANTCLGYWQENKAENVLALLRSYIRTRARVTRAGREYQIDAATLVPGDIIRVSQGDRIPADGRIIYANNFEVDESILTGESLPVEKRKDAVPAATAINERVSMILGGTLVTQGFADAVVTATGSHTEFGSIAAMASGREREATPLQQAMQQMSLRFGMILAVLIALLFFLGISLRYGIWEMLLISIAVAVAAVPEGLPITLTVILAMGVQRLAKRKSIVRRLIAAETMGSVDIILTDKTGTLTKAEMQLTGIVPIGRQGEIHEHELLRLALFNTMAVVENPADNAAAWKVVGRPIEVALVRAAGLRGMTLPDILKKARILDRKPFDSADKASAVIVESAGGGTRLALLGAPEVLLGFSKMDEGERGRILASIGSRARSGERILGIATAEIPSGSSYDLAEKKFRNLSFEGILAFRDPLRPSTRAAIERIASSGVKTAIVTGDHEGTAEAVARDLGLIDGAGAVITGEDMYHLSDAELHARLDDITVFARVTPEQKVRVVQAYQHMGYTVAVTGDGVNDAPALRTADIGVAVGSGTDVAKAVADIVILDDNFETIVASIEEGRRILDNIRKAIVYLFSGIFDELFLIGGSLLFGVALPLTALQILFVNLIADSFPAIAFARESGLDGAGRSPRKRRGLFDRSMRFFIFVIGTSTSVLLLALYMVLLRTGVDPALVRTFIFASFAIYTLFLAFAVRSLEHSIFSYNPFSNRFLTLGVGLGSVLTAAILYVPFLQRVFGTVSLSPLWLGAVVGVGIANVLALEAGKWVMRKERI